MVSFDAKPYSKRLLHLISWSHWFTFFNIIAAILLSSFYVFSETTPDTLLGQIYLVTNWTSHMGFLTFMSFVLILFPITLLWPRTKFIRTAGSVIFTVGLFLLLLDAFVYSRLGYHLNASSNDQIIALVTNLIEHNSIKFWLFSSLAFTIILLFELVVSNYAWKHLRDLQETIFARFVVFALVLFFFISHIAHIWADANLEYDILRQDTLLPLSYPSTAKTLLTKYGMFDRSDYIERRSSKISFSDPVPPYPLLGNQCPDEPLQQSVFIVLTNKILTLQQIQLFADRSSADAIELNHHVDNALRDDAWFNLFYSLPTIYQSALLKQPTKPLLFQWLDKQQASKTLTVIGAPLTTAKANFWFEPWFDQKTLLSDVSSLIFSDHENFTAKLNTMPKGLHFIYFNEASTSQFELFMDALLLAQKEKQNKDIIWLSSIGNHDDTTSLSMKPSLLVLPNNKNKTINRLSSNMDLQPTLMKHWLNCQLEPTLYSNGKDFFEIEKNRIIANTMDSGIMVFNKDQSVFIDQYGNFQSFSRQLEAPIMVNSDFPLLIDGVHLIKQFSKQTATEQ